MLLRVGSRGEEVKKIQRFLGISADGIFGKITEREVKKYQTSKGLVSDGIVGPKTLNQISKDGYYLKPEPPKKEIEDSDILDIIGSNSLEIPSNKYNDKKTIFDYNQHIVVVAIRGFKLEMGNKLSNDRGIYDDAHFIYTPNGVISFPANTDPSGYRKGYGTGSKKGMACLDEGVWAFNKGLHKGRLAFRQAMPFRVIRDGNPPYPHTGWHAINWHNGNISTTSSLGCQTNRQTDFDTLRVFLYNQLEVFDNPKMYNDRSLLERAFPYILIDEKERRKGNLIVK